MARIPGSRSASTRASASARILPHRPVCNKRVSHTSRSLLKVEVQVRRDRTEGKLQTRNAAQRDDGLLKVEVGIVSMLDLDVYLYSSFTYLPSLLPGNYPA